MNGNRWFHIFGVKNVQYFLESNIDIFGYFLDRLRVVPRLILFGYMWIVSDMLIWAKGLETMTTQQATLVGTMVGFGTPLFAFYINASTMLNKKGDVSKK